MPVQQINELNVTFLSQQMFMSVLTLAKGFT